MEDFLLEDATVQSLHNFKGPLHCPMESWVRSNSSPLEVDNFSFGTMDETATETSQTSRANPIPWHYQQLTPMKYGLMQSGRWEVHTGIHNIMAQLIVGNGIPKKNIGSLLENCQNCGWKRDLCHQRGGNKESSF